MSIPLYKKRPQWWLKLLSIFNMTDKQYWLGLLCNISISAIVFLSEYSLYDEHILLIYYLISCCLTGPFGYYWAKQKLQNLPNDGFKFYIISEPIIFAVIFAPIILIYVLLKHYLAK